MLPKDYFLDVTRKRRTDAAMAMAVTFQLLMISKSKRRIAREIDLKHPLRDYLTFSDVCSSLRDTAFYATYRMYPEVFLSYFQS